MSDKSAIEWLTGKDGTRGSTWNPIRARNLETGAIGWHCEHASEGCRNCYAEKTNRGFFQLGTRLPYVPLARAKVEIFLDEKTLLQPLHWKRPRKVFPCSMTDWAGRWVSDDWMDKLLAVAALCPQHTFLFLTKRADRLLEYLATDQVDQEERQCAIGEQAFNLTGTLMSGEPSCGEDFMYMEWPLPNVWIGVSIEDQKTADERIPKLIQMPAAVRFISAEPLLGPVDLSRWIMPFEISRDENGSDLGSASGGSDIDWVIVGGESGPHSRPMHPDWARSLRDQCVAAGVSFFFKQWGGWVPIATPRMKARIGTTLLIHPDGRTAPANWDDVMTSRGEVWAVERVGKKAAGRLLEGREWNEYPELLK